MVKLDATIMQYLEDEDFRVLAALELAMRNHELVPTPLIERIANLPRGGALNRLQTLLRYKLIHHERRLYEGYTLKYAAYDFLALHALTRRGVLTGIGPMIGSGKESDIYLCKGSDERGLIVKLERLGRTSFRSVIRNRNYTKSERRRGANWYYLSRLAATKEYNFLCTLHEKKFPVPTPVDHNRHAIVMERIEGDILSHVRTLRNPEKTYHGCMELLVRLCRHGLVHGDFNEFNLIISSKDEKLVMIDFPQMISVNRKNARELFDRDVRCINHFFRRRYKLFCQVCPDWVRETNREADLYDSRIKDKTSNRTQTEIKASPLEPVATLSSEFLRSSERPPEKDQKDFCSPSPDEEDSLLLLDVPGGSSTHRHPLRPIALPRSTAVTSISFMNKGQKQIKPQEEFRAITPSGTLPCGLPRIEKGAEEKLELRSLSKTSSGHTISIQNPETEANNSSRPPHFFSWLAPHSKVVRHQIAKESGKTSFKALQTCCTKANQYKAKNKRQIRNAINQIQDLYSEKPSTFM